MTTAHVVIADRLELEAALDNLIWTRLELARSRRLLAQPGVCRRLRRLQAIDVAKWEEWEADAEARLEAVYKDLPTDTLDRAAHFLHVTCPAEVRRAAR